MEKAFENRLEYLDISRGIAILLIVWAHVDLKMDPYFYNRYLYTVHEIIYSFHVPLLFLISGVLSKLSIDTPQFDLRIYLKKNFQRILVPFYFLSLIYMLINLLAPESFLDSPSIQEMLLSLVYMQSHPIFLPSGVLWFLFALFAITSVNAIIISHFRYSRWGWFLFSVILFFLSELFSKNYLFAIDRISHNLVFFVGGYLLSNFVINLQKTNQIWTMILLVAFGIISFYGKMEGIDILHLFTGFSFAIVSIGITVYLSRHKTKAIDIAIFMGRRSMPIFVLHMPVALICFKFITWFNLSNKLSGFIIALIVCTCGPLLIAKITEYSTPIYKLMFGRSPI